jgi:hypothetical protein
MNIHEVICNFEAFRDEQKAVVESLHEWYEENKDNVHYTMIEDNVEQVRIEKARLGIYNEMLRWLSEMSAQDKGSADLQQPTGQAQNAGKR